MTVFFADAALEIFETLPEETKRRAAFAIDLIAIFPQMYPIRYRGSCADIATLLPGDT